MQRYLEFFERWRTEMRGRGGTYKDYSKTFLATETYRSLKVTIYGFYFGNDSQTNDRQTDPLGHQWSGGPGLSLLSLMSIRGHDED
jgi:hypothetical protein